MSDEFVSCTRSQGICTLTLKRPPVNALNLALYRTLARALDEIEADDTVRVVLLCAQLDRQIFSAGADIKEFDRLFEPREAREFFELAQAVPNRFERLRQATVVAIDGLILGGAAELCLSFDFRIFGQGARIGFPEVGVGQFPGTGGTLRLPWLIGESRARQLLLSGEIIDARQAYAFGLANELCEEGQALAVAQARAEALVNHPAQAIAAIKWSVFANRDRDLEAGSRRDTELSLWVGESQDAREGQAAFLEKREPRFSHIVPPPPDVLVVG